MSQSLFCYEMKIYKNNQLIKTFNCPRQPFANILQVLLFNNLNYKIEIKSRSGDILTMTSDDFRSSNS